tara:strand:+ start:284 stop:469 length:186 start_codon:yes stop_codon:yes gene_type:complete
MKPVNDHEAYNLALRLSITAPSKKLCEECSQIAETIGQRLTESYKTKCRETIEKALQEITK